MMPRLPCRNASAMARVTSASASTTRARISCSSATAIARRSSAFACGRPRRRTTEWELSWQGWSAQRPGTQVPPFQAGYIFAGYSRHRSSSTACGLGGGPYIFVTLVHWRPNRPRRRPQAAAARPSLASGGFLQEPEFQPGHLRPSSAAAKNANMAGSVKRLWLQKTLWPSASDIIRRQACATGTVRSSMRSRSCQPPMCQPLLAKCQARTDDLCLQRLDPNGRVLAVLGDLRDDGLEGDVAAGDRIYSGAGTPPPQVSILPPANLSVTSQSSTTVTGTVDDPAATAEVNGGAAPVSGGGFTVGAPSREGRNSASERSSSTWSSTRKIRLVTNPSSAPPRQARRLLRACRARVRSRSRDPRREASAARPRMIGRRRPIR